MIKRPWHLWLISLFMVFMYSMGIYDLFMMLSHNAGYYASHGYGIAVVEYFTDYPIFSLLFWLANLLFGFLSPVFLWMKRFQLAARFALASAMADLILLIITFSFENRWNILGASIALFDFFILAITFGLYFYCKYVGKENR